MNRNVHNRRRGCVAAVVYGALALAIAGCDGPDEIRVRNVPKILIEQEAFEGLEVPQDMILAALVPHADEAWVFRLSGPKEDVQAQRDDFEAFVASLAFSEGKPLPDWELPTGWEAASASAGSLREASIRVPLEGGGSLDLSVSRLPAREDWLHYRLRNVNRWRTQLQLPVAGADELEQASESVELEKSRSVSASIVALEGKFTQTGPASMAMQPPPSSPPAESSPPAASPAASGLSYETPAGWSPGPASPARRASLVVRDGDAEASVAVTVFPKTGLMADPLANINRWRGEVGLPPIGEGQASGAAEAIEVDGAPGLYVALDGTGDAADVRATRAVMVERGDRVWFLKLQGPKSLVRRETDRFREFVQSVEFSE